MHAPVTCALGAQLHFPRITHMGREVLAEDAKKLIVGAPQ